MTRGSGGVDQATPMLEAVPDATIAEEAAETASVREQIRERRSVRTLNSADRRTILLVVPIVMLLIIGLGAMLSAASVFSIREYGDHLYAFKRQVVWVGLGLVSLVGASRIPYRLYRRYALPIFALAIAGLIATLLIGTVRNGARRWIEIWSVTIQASEFAKLATVIVVSAVLVKKERLLGSLAHLVLPVAAILGVVSGLLLLQPDFGTTLLIVAAAFAIIFSSAAPLGFVVGLGGITAVLGTIGAFAMDYRRVRMTGFLRPFDDPLGAGHQAVQSLVALGTGGWFGVGLGASRARWSFLPNAHTDFIFAIIGEETGFVGAGLVLVLFAFFTAIGIRVALGAPDMFGRLLAVGIVSWLTFQALVNIGGVIAVLPITGVPLPFVSSGGTAMIVNLAAVGVLINISRTRTTEPVPS